jgi:nicotinamide phosphoribosyltransferase
MKTLSSFRLFGPHMLDSYKISHADQYPDGTEVIYSNFTPRNDKYFPGRNARFYDHKVVWIGLQGTIKEIAAIWQESFFDHPKAEVLERYASRVWPFTGAASREECSLDRALARLGELHDLGYLPILVKSLPEGTLVPFQVPVFTVRNTLPKFYWLTNSLETVLSNESWKLCTNATIAHEYRKILDHWAVETGGPLDFVEWQGHNFADRGMSGMHDAAKNGAGHSLSFAGTDSVSAIDWIDWAYGADFMHGSVPATEHSVVCAGGKEGEAETFSRLLDLYPTGVWSYVSDTWDFWGVVAGQDSLAARFKDKILARKPNAIGLAKTVFRPDSGNPADILCGTAIPLETLEWGWQVSQAMGKAIKEAALTGTLEPKVWVKHRGKYYEAVTYGENPFIEVEPTPEMKGAVECLWEIFGGTTTDKGFKVLDSHVGLIYGDSITLGLADEICQRLAAKGFASCNVVLGIGSYTYAFSTRDSQGWAMKATFAQVNGEARELFKQPKTDPGKNSAKGLLRVEIDPETRDYVLHDQQTPEQEQGGCLRTLFKDGQFIETELKTFGQIRTTLGIARVCEMKALAEKA